MKAKRPVVAVGMSGGVDSSVTAFLLQKQGYQVIGVTMKLWTGAEGSVDNRKSGCYGPNESGDQLDAQEICRKLGIPHHVIDVSNEYSTAVLQNFRREYRSGRTPNPCVLCNPLIKFGALWQQARKAGVQFDLFATGHYARVAFNDQSQRFELLKAAHPAKDQSYFLYRLTQAQLAGTLFPLGEMTKQQVRTVAVEAGFSEIADKPESQDFADADTRQFTLLQEQRKPGRIIDLQGKVLGEHTDIGSFTLGQRRGLKIGGLKVPAYVIAIDPISGNITVGPKENLAVAQLTAGDLNWIAFAAITSPVPAACRCRSRQEESACRIAPAAEDTVTVEFNQPQYSATPGQSIVFYQDEKVLGGGIIQKIHKV